MAQIAPMALITPIAKSQQPTANSQPPTYHQQHTSNEHVSYTPMSDIDKSADETCPISTSFCPILIRDLALAVITFVTNNEGNDCPQHTFTSKPLQL